MAPSIDGTIAVSTNLLPAFYSLKLKTCSKAADQLSSLDDRRLLYRDSPLAWKGSQFTNKTYIYILSEPEIAEVDKALYHYKGILF